MDLQSRSLKSLSPGWFEYCWAIRAWWGKEMIRSWMLDEVITDFGMRTPHLQKPCRERFMGLNPYRWSLTGPRGNDGWAGSHGSSCQGEATIQIHFIVIQSDFHTGTHFLSMLWFVNIRSSICWNPEKVPDVFILALFAYWAWDPVELTLSIYLISRHLK